MYSITFICLFQVNIPKISKQEKNENATSFRLSSLSPPLPSVLSEPLSDDSKPTQKPTSLQFNQPFVNGRKENTNEFKYGMCRIKTTPVSII